MFKVENKTKQTLWSILVYAFNKGRRRGMMGELTEPFAIHVGAPYDPASGESGHIVLSVPVWEFPHTGLLPQMTGLFWEVQPISIHII